MSIVLILAACGSPAPTDLADAPPPLVQAMKPVGPMTARLAWAPNAEREPSAPPIALTGADGTSLRLVSVDARAVLQDPLAFTELRLAFDNPSDRTIEGNFSMTLPRGATVSRFAMKIDDRWQEGEVVEKQSARVVYEDFLHRRQDPALLEKGAGNVFQARVFPIPAGARKEIILSYSEVVRGDRWAVPLAGLPRVDVFDARVSIDNGDLAPLTALEVHEKDIAPGDLGVTLESPENFGVRDGDLVAFRVHPRFERSDEPLDGLTILFDTSGSRALGFGGQVDRLVGVVDAIRSADGDFPLDVQCFDQLVAQCFSGQASAFDTTAIRARGAFGASDLGKALAAVDGKRSRVLIVGDGVATAGADTAAELKSAAAALADRGVVRIDALVDGGMRDEDALHAIVAAGLPHEGVVLDADRTAGTVAAHLLAATSPPIEVHVDRAEFVWPDTLHGIQAGDDVVIVARLPADAPLNVTLDGASLSGAIQLANVARPLLDRAVTEGEIASLERKVSPESPEIANQIVALSTAHRVLSSRTALLVLETEADYDRFHIDRKALTDILTVGESGIDVVHRSEVVVPVGGHPAVEPTTTADRAGVSPSTAPSSAVLQLLTTRGDSNSGTAKDLWADQDGNVGSLRGISGSPSSGENQGSELADIGYIGGIGSVAAEASAPPLVQVQVGEGQAERLTEGDQGLVKKIVQKNAGQLRYCYESRLKANANLTGRVEIEWHVTAGRVTSAELFANTTGDPDLASCIIGKIKRWTFPPEVEGDVQWPFIFRQRPAEGVVPQAPHTTPAPPAPRPATPPVAPPATPAVADAWEGRFSDVMTAHKAGDDDKAWAIASSWHAEAPGDVLALVALGEIAEGTGRNNDAARYYGSIIDLFPSRADLRRMAGERLERVALSEPSALDLVVDTYRHAAIDRPDHPSSHRLLAYALLKAGHPKEAFTVIEAGASRQYPDNRFRGVTRILREDAGLIGSAWAAASPDDAPDMEKRLAAVQGVVPKGPSVRFVLSWETDANDVDFHIYDHRGGHAWYSQQQLASGGELYADVTTGYGPECFAIDQPSAGPYRLQAKYYRQGPMGYGMGKLEIVAIDKKGALTFDERPFVIQKDGAFFDLGTWP